MTTFEVCARAATRTAQGSKVRQRCTLHVTSGYVRRLVVHPSRTCTRGWVTVPPMRDDAPWLWLAGLLEGEGWFGMHGKSRTKKVPCIELQMTDEDVVAAAAKIMGGTYRKVVRADRPEHMVSYRCRVTGGRAVSVMRNVLPLMGARRAATISNLITLSHA